MDLLKYINPKNLINSLFPKKEYTNYSFKKSLSTNGYHEFETLEEIAQIYLGSDQLRLNEKKSIEGIHYKDGIFLENIIEKNNPNTVLKTRIELEKDKNYSELIKEFENFYNITKD